MDHLKRLKHSNIIDLYGYSNDSPTTPCLIYPFMENGSLEKRLHHYKETDDKHLTAISFKNQPTKSDVDVDFSIKCVVKGGHSTHAKVV